MPRLEQESSLWNEERLRYDVLRLVYERAGARCEETVTGPEIGTALDLPFEDLFRLTFWLDSRGYLLYLGAGPRVCISQKGITYVEERAGYRRSVRE